jgi:hypothetical protein
MRKSFSFQIGEKRVSSLFDKPMIVPSTINTNGDIEMGLLLSNEKTQDTQQSQYKIVVWFNKYKIEFINVSMSVFLHVFVMIIFEIYFYFNYVISIEKKAFIDKIDQYFDELTQYDTQVLIYNMVEINNAMDTLYANYLTALDAQHKLLHHLLYIACELGGGFGIAFIISWGLGIAHYNQIKWKTIFAENIVMLGLLGCFEYLFFMHIVMNYNPITDAELEYIVAQKAYAAFGHNQTMHPTVQDIPS